MAQPVLVVFGGIAPEHEVSVVTGLQALEKIDTARFEPHVVYMDQKGATWYLPGLRDRYGFNNVKRVPAAFGRDAEGGYLRAGGMLGTTIRPYAAFLASHGGTGENGPVQGLMKSIGIPATGPSVESAAIAMNKKLTKQTVAPAGVPVLEDECFFADEIEKDASACAARAISTVRLPAIVKPVHLGSSIGIKVAKTEVELQKALLEAAHMDTEIMVEPFLEGITEYNCAVRELADGSLEASEIERPVSNDEILSFADKYERGGKKQGGGMASLSRELPAKIAPEHKRALQELATKAYRGARQTGMARLDFMQSSAGELYLTEINPIPGSLAYYLWEASGIPYQTQITDALEAAVARATREEGLALEYKSDIVERFCTPQ